MIWISYKPQVRTEATEVPEQAGAILPTTPPLSPPPPPSPSAEPEPQKSEKSEDDGGAGGGQSPEPAEPPPVVPAEKVLLRNSATRMCADLPGNDKGQVNMAVQQAGCVGTASDNQLWNLEVKYPKLGPGGTPLFQIRNVKDQFCMDLGEYGGRPVGTGIGEFHCDGTTADNQLWWIDKQDNGDYWIRNYASNGRCLNVNGGASAGDRLNISDCSNTGNQEWKIVHPKND